MIKIFILAVIIALSAAAAWYLTPNQSEKYWYESVSVGVGFVSCLLSLFVLYIAHTVEKHILTKVSLNDIRKLQKRTLTWDLSKPSMNEQEKAYAQTIITAAINDKNIQGYIKEKLSICQKELQKPAPSCVNFLNYLDSVVQCIDLT